MQTLFKKLEYRFLVESTKIDNITFPYKIALLRQIKWAVQNLPITKNGVLPVTTFHFRKFCFSLGTSYIVLIRCTTHPHVHIHIFRKCWSFTLGCFFPVNILKTNLNETKIRTFQDYVCNKN